MGSVYWFGPMRMLVITSATAYMDPSPKNPLYLGALAKAGLSVPTSDIENESLYLGTAHSFARQAKDIFGGHVKGVLKGVERARSQGIKVDLFLISHRYGIVAECDQLIPYAFSLAKKPKKVIRQFSEKMHTKELVRDLFRKNYDITILIINRSDLPFVHDPKQGFDIGNNSSRLLVIGAPSLSNLIKGNVEFQASKSLGKRVDRFLSFIEEATRTTLRDF